MNQSDLKKIVTEQFKNILKEGTWALPYKKSQARRLQEIQMQLKTGDFSLGSALTKELYNVLGDDILFDQISTRLKEAQRLIADDLLKRINEIINSYERDSSKFKQLFEPEAMDIIKKMK